MNKKNEITIRSSAAEYLTYVASVGKNTTIDLTAAGTKIFDPTGKQISLNADTLVLDTEIGRAHV